MSLALCSGHDNTHQALSAFPMSEHRGSAESGLFLFDGQACPWCPPAYPFPLRPSCSSGWPIQRAYLDFSACLQRTDHLLSPRFECVGHVSQRRYLPPGPQGHDGSGSRPGHARNLVPVAMSDGQIGPQPRLSQPRCRFSSFSQSRNLVWIAYGTDRNSLALVCDQYWSSSR